MKVKVARTIPVWRSDDGSRTKYNVITDTGEVFLTWSKAIGEADQGREFDVVVEERDFYGRTEKYIKQAMTQSLRPMGRGMSTQDRDSIERQVALKCAVEFATSREKMKSADVVKLAEAFDAFLKRGHDTTENTSTNE